MENEFTLDPTDEFDDIAPRNNRMNDLIFHGLVETTLAVMCQSFGLRQLAYRWILRECLGIKAINHTLNLRCELWTKEGGDHGDSARKTRPYYAKVGRDYSERASSGTVINAVLFFLPIRKDQRATTS
jgi:hypothetical protein